MTWVSSTNYFEEIDVFIKNYKNQNDDLDLKINHMEV